MKFNILDILFASLFFVAIYIFIKAPIRRRLGASELIDPLFSFSLVIISIIYVYFAHYAVNLIPESDYAPCGRYSKQMECYHLSQDTCMSAWHNSLGDCEDKLAEIRRQRPTALLGSYLDTCIGKNFDKVMRYNRKSLNEPSCQNYFNKVRGAE